MNYKVSLVSIDCNQELATQLLHSVLIESGVDVKSFYIKSNPHDVDAAGQLEEKDIEVFFDHLKKFNPDLVGFSLKSPIFDSARNLTKKTRTVLSDTKVIWGGVHPSISPEESIKHSDFVCVGEGEESLLELVKKLSNGEKGNDVQNIWARENGSIRKNSQRASVENLDALPLPKINDGNHFFISNGKIGNTFSLPEWTILTSRGCPFKCWFCTNETIDEIYKRRALRRRSVGNVIDELVQVKSKLENVEIISFQDDIFTVNQRWIEEFVPQYKKKIGLPFIAQTHPTFVKTKVITLLKEAGLQALMMGIQSGSERVRKEVFFRKTSDQHILNAVNILKEVNIPYVRYDLIHNNPYETRQDKLNTVNLLLKFPRPVGLNIFQLHWYPKTKLTEKALKEGIISEQQIEGKVTNKHAFQRGVTSFNYKEDIYFANLYYLATSSYFPMTLVRFLSNYHFFERYPIIIDNVVFFTKFLKFFFFGLNGLFKILQGKGSKENIFGGLEMLKRFIRPTDFQY